MGTGKRSFRPGIFPSVITVIFVSVLSSLGVWQMNRAGQKLSMAEEFRSRKDMPVIQWHGLMDDESQWRRVRITGRYHDRWRILLDNQVYRGRAGYHVFTPFNPTGTDTWMLVNRGWIPAGDYRSSLPEIDTPVGEVSLTAVVMEPPYSGVLLDREYLELFSDGVLRTQSIKLDGLRDYTHLPLQSYVLQLEPQAVGGFIRDWPQPGFGRERNLGYAFQWFALAAAAVIIYLCLYIKKTGPE